MATYKLGCNVTSGTGWSVGGRIDPIIVTGLGSNTEQKIVKVRIYAASAGNPGYYFYDSGNHYHAAGSLQRKDIKFSLTVNGVESNPVIIKYNNVNLKGNHGAYSTYADHENYYDITFPQTVIINGNSQFRYNASPVNGNNCLLIRRKRGDMGYVETTDVTHYPDKISLSQSEVTITNSTGKTKNGSTIFNDSQKQVTLNVSPADAELSKLTWSGNKNCSINYNSSNSTITIKANNNTADSGTVDTVTFSCEGGASTTLKVNFYKKPSLSVKTNTVNTNATGLHNTKFELNSFNCTGNGISGSGYYRYRYRTAGASSWNGWKSSPNPLPSNKTIDVSSYFTTNKSSNIFDIGNDAKKIELQYRYINPTVQSMDEESNPYKAEFNAYYTFYARPKTASKFSYSYVKSNGTVSNEAPSIFLPGLGDGIIPGNLKYDSTIASSGYCRGFRVEYLKGSQFLYADYKTATVKSGICTASGPLLVKDDSVWKILKSKADVTDEITMKITCCFFFDGENNVNNRTWYSGYSVTLKQKLMLLTEEDLLPQLLFPITNTKAPATKMMLDYVERFGYIIPDIGVKKKTELGLSFHLDVNGTILDFGDQNLSRYFSNTALTTHIVFDAGRYVRDNNLQLTQCIFVPYVTIYTGTLNEKKIYVKDTWQKPNITMDLTSMWTRPQAKKGEKVTYHDYNNFITYINKYMPLYNNKKFPYEVPEQRGTIVNVSFWKQIAEILDVYSKNMVNWATDIQNDRVIWQEPEFKHKQGEYITNNNLYQNYWDLLNQFSAYDKFATHYYINSSGYSHDDLHAFTHNDIKNKRGI